MLKDIHDSHGTVSNLFCQYLSDLQLKIWEIYKKCSNSVKFWAWKMFFFLKWVRILSEIDWIHYQGASPAPMCIVRHQTMTETPTRWNVTSEPSVPSPPFFLFSSVVYFSQRRSARINKLVQWKMIGLPKNPRLDPIGHFGPPCWPFWIY